MDTGTLTCSPTYSDPDVVVVLHALMDSNEWCSVADGLACPDCHQAAKQMVHSLRHAGRLGPPPDRAWLMSLDFEYWDISTLDPDVRQITAAASPSCFGLARQPTHAAKVAVAALRNHHRLGVLLAGEPAGRLMKLLQQHQALRLLDQPVKLSSGQFSKFYIDLRIITDPQALWRLGVLFADTVVETVGLDGFDAVFGPAYAGIPLAVVTSQALWRRHRVRKLHLTMRSEPKRHGAGGLFVGRPIAGRRVAMVDDVLTTAGTKISNHQRIVAEGVLMPSR